MAKRISARVGSYEKNGETKGRYQDIGVIMSSDKGDYVLLNPGVSLAGVFTMQTMDAKARGGKTGDRIMCSIFDDDNGSGGNSGGSRGGYDQPSGRDSQGQGGGSRGRDIDDDIPF